MPGFPDSVVTHTEEVMGTVVSFRVHRIEGEGHIALDAIASSCALLHDIDRTFSTWIENSPMSRLRRGEVALGDVQTEITEVIRLCEHAKELSGGWFDPWSLPGGLDPTGLVKGWALDRALRVMVEAGFTDVLLNAGGDLVASGSPGDGEFWRAGIRHPWRPESLACVVRIDTAIATSGRYERGDHLVDPFRGERSSATASASVVGPDLALSDALATALAVGGDAAFDPISKLPGISAYMIRPDGSEMATDSFPFVDDEAC